MLTATPAAAKDFLSQHQRMAKANADDTLEEWANWGPAVTLWRRFRDGNETEETMPEFLAKVTLEAIPEREPHVERAKLIYG